MTIAHVVNTNGKNKIAHMQKKLTRTMTIIAIVAHIAPRNAGTIYKGKNGGVG